MEEFVRHRLLPATFDGSAGGSVRTLVVQDDEHEIVAIGAHKHSQLVVGDGESIMAAQLLALAMTLGWQGRRHRGTRVSDMVFRLLVGDALRVRNADVAHAIVHRGNQRSLRLCERNGLTSQSLLGRDYVRLTGRFAAGPPS